jgi:O6-methylguanine-DNA--protein-cysteine methyltransferase
MTVKPPRKRPRTLDAEQLRRVGATFPPEGDFVRVTLRREQQSWQGTRLVTIPAGTTYEGIAADVDTEGFFTLVNAANEQRKFYLTDSALHIQVVARIRTV